MPVLRILLLAQVANSTLSKGINVAHDSVGHGIQQLPIAP